MDTVLFFDGVCGLCNAVVDFLIRKDTRRQLKFAALQGATAKQVLPPDLIGAMGHEFATVVLFDEGVIYLRSTAVLRALVKIGGFWKLIGSLGYIFPRFFRDWVYNLVAANRYQMFGKKEACRIPTKQERQFFLD